MATLAEIRAKLLAQDSKSADNANANRGTDAIYPFWNMDTDSTSVIRFLPDSDNSNTFFWRERQIIKMPFPGVKDGDESKPVTVQVPCIEMWGDTCPVHAEIRPWFKDPAMEDIGRKYWKKRSYIFQGFVVTDPMNEATPENPIRRFVIGPQIFKLLKSALMDPDMENLPTDYDAGTDFRLTKTQKGQYADYSTSNWARKERSLNEEERQAIETHGLYDLNDFMPKRPNEEEQRIIMEMFEASVDGHLYDPEKWGSFYKPYGLDVGNSKPANAQTTAPAVEEAKAPVAQNSTPAETPAPAPKAVATPQPAMAEAGAPASGGQGTDAADILKMIRSRKAD
ncbi:MAG: hypothetical protein CMD92_07850 [Gammaproteobacteria bacterium]|nr:hypothetical protein [Gammaproteobacteria bacterium]